MSHAKNAVQLLQAAVAGDLATLKAAICPGLDINQFPPVGLGFPWQSALHAAAEGGHSHVVGFLLALGADPWAMAPSPMGSFNALHPAASRGHYETVRVLLDAGADVGATFSDGEWEGPATLLVLGDYRLYRRRDEGEKCEVEQRHTDMIELLLDRGANINASPVFVLVRFALGSVRPCWPRIIKLILKRK